MTPKQHRAILEYAQEFFGHATMRLFGSRLDDTKKGWNIDLYIQTDDTNGKSVNKKSMSSSTRGKIVPSTVLRKQKALFYDWESERDFVGIC